MRNESIEGILSILSINPERLNGLRLNLMNWHEAHGRHGLPWKLKPDGTSPNSGEMIIPYGIWIAEVMLQQTQVKVVLPYWEKWILTLPTLEDLVKSSEQEVLMLWQGLGYYSRARRIHQAAQQLFDLIGELDSLDPASWPSDIEMWMALPGIGRTTAASIVSSAFDIPQALLDGNVRRVLGRMTANPKLEKDSLVELWTISERLLDRNNPRNFNQALMDLGSIVCTPRNPNCSNCPWSSECIAYSSRQVMNFPVKATKTSLPFQVIGVGVVFNASGQVIIDQRLNEGFLGGMWEFPGGKQKADETIQETIVREIREELSIEVEVLNHLVSLEHVYSHKKLAFEVYICKWISGTPKALASQQFKWVNPNELDQFPFPSANAQMILSLKKYLLRQKS